jgi:superfamily II DNA helicase RecQ
MDEDTFDKALEKLWIHKGAMVDFAENVSLGSGKWRTSYSLQMEQKQGAVEEILRFAQGHHCRMKALIHHFGDTSDNGAGCQICDFCAPEDCVAQRFCSPSNQERVAAEIALDKLRTVPAKSTGKLYTEIYSNGGMTRDNFEEVLGGLARAGLVKMEDAVFEKQGKRIPYKNVSLTEEGRELEEGQVSAFTMRMAVESPSGTKRERGKKPSSKPAKAAKADPVAPSEGQVRLEEALRAWRLKEAKRRNMPAFRIFGDQTLRNIASSRPQSDSALLAVPGIGPNTVEKYGAQIFHLVASTV